MSANEKTGDEHGTESDEVNAERRTSQVPDGGHEVPLFLRDSSDAHQGNAQDEKDETGE